MNVLKAAVLCGVLVISLAMVGGCRSSRQDGPVTARSVRRNLSPELRGVAMSKQQIKNARARSWDLDRRQAVDDWHAIWLTDRPMRMSKYPIP